MCWPAGLAGAFFVALIIMDIIQKEYSILPTHGIIGVCVTGILWILCELIGTSLTMAVLVIPGIFMAIFLFTVWFMDESMKKRGCCMTCGEDKKKKAHLVKKEHPTACASCASCASSASMVGLVDSGKGYKKENIFITGGKPILLPEFIKNHIGPNSAQETCINNKLTATPSV